jgi:hypothetical protein
MNIFGLSAATLVIVAAAALTPTAPAQAAAGAQVPHQEFRSAACANDFCLVDFNIVPDNKRLEVTNVSCQYTAAPNTARVVAAFFSGSK